MLLKLLGTEFAPKLLHCDKLQQRSAAVRLLTVAVGFEVGVRVGRRVGFVVGVAVGVAVGCINASSKQDVSPSHEDAMGGNSCEWPRAHG